MYNFFLGAKRPLLPTAAAEDPPRSPLPPSLPPPPPLPAALLLLLRPLSPPMPVLLRLLAEDEADACFLGLGLCLVPAELPLPPRLFAPPLYPMLTPSSSSHLLSFHVRIRLYRCRNRTNLTANHTAKVLPKSAKQLAHSSTAFFCPRRRRSLFGQSEENLQMFLITLATAAKSVRLSCLKGVLHWRRLFDH
jgi:hypothetical protein